MTRILVEESAILDLWRYMWFFYLNLLTCRRWGQQPPSVTTYICTFSCLLGEMQLNESVRMNSFLPKTSNSLIKISQSDQKFRNEELNGEANIYYTGLIRLCKKFLDSRPNAHHSWRAHQEKFHFSFHWLWSIWYYN